MTTTYPVREYRMKCEDCQEVQFTESELAECECGGYLTHIDAFAVVMEDDYGY